MSTHQLRRDPDNTDAGFTLIEVLIVIVILGVLAAVIAFSVRGITDKGEEASCDADYRTLDQAAEIYLVQERVDLIPADGTVLPAERFEATLVTAGLLKQTSDLWTINADGTLIAQASICTP